MFNMYIPFSTIAKKYKLDTNKYILHLGAHVCEENSDYIAEGFDQNKIIWVEGNESLVSKTKQEKPHINIYEALISDQDNQIVDFIITNNMQSSSILELDEHLKEHPAVRESKRYKKTTTRADSFLNKIGLSCWNIEFVNIDLQGAELLALKGFGNLLFGIKYLYLEVNTKHLYKNCALLSEIDEYLYHFGFIRREIEMTQHGWGDALYVQEIFNECNPLLNGESLLLNSLTNANVIFDVGSRFDSECTNLEKEVHYFEPLKSHLDKLKLCQTKNRKSFYNNFGLSNKNEDLLYYMESEAFYDRGGKEQKKCLLSLKTAKEYIVSNNITNIDFVKIDTEGFELNVIQGFEDKLNIVQKIQFEYGGTFRERGIKLIDVINYLKQYGFKHFSYVSKNGILPILSFDDHYQYCNILCLR